MDEGLRVELIERIEHDDAVRERLARDGSLFEGYNAEMEAVHRENANWLAAIVDAYGWAGRSSVGEEAAAAAMRILQHAIGEPAHVDERRRSVGLRAMQWQLPLPPDEPPPEDLAARRAEGEAWARRVGWR
jgi:hypothetical protein